MSPRHIPLFDRASTRWWNPQFASTALETQYWKCSFPQLRDRFRSVHIREIFFKAISDLPNIFPKDLLRIILTVSQTSIR